MLDGNVSSDGHSENDNESKHKNTFILTEDMKEKLVNLPEVLQFIEKLLEYVEKHRCKLKRLKKKFKKSQSLKDRSKDASVQTDDQQKESSVVDVKEKLENSNNSSEQVAKSIAEDIKDAAEQAIQNSGFVYEETSGMYYDYNTGYYYNAEYGLYYDGTTGLYLKYNQDTQSYEYHSQVATEQTNHSEAPTQKQIVKRKSRVREKTKARKRKHIEKGNEDIDFEEGECSDSSSIDGISSLEEDAESDSSDVSKQWPPCMRIIVEETSVPKLKTGSLHIVTFEGGSIGREGNHAILIPDINISKHHLNISFNKDTNTFQAVDMGSRNGTLLNGARMAPSKQESETLDVVHGSRIQLGSTVLLCHVHDGHQTCGHCEPGLIGQQEKKDADRATKSTKSESHKKELQNLKKKFGMSSFQEDSSKLASGYTDRAQKRRETIGSQNPHEKTQAASVEESIAPQNKGFKLLSKMGWKEGQSLGKEGSGILEPINLVSNEGTTGIGCSTPTAQRSVGPKAKQENKKNIWMKTQERFDKLPEAHNAFEDSE